VELDGPPGDELPLELEFLPLRGGGSCRSEALVSEVELPRPQRPSAGFCSELGLPSD
jgi:hypothetical protein